MLAYAAALDASGQHQRELQCSVAWHKVRHLSSYLRVGGWVLLNCTAAGLDAEMPQCSLCAGEYFGALKLWSSEDCQSFWCRCLAFFVCVVVSCVRHSADALMYWCMKLCFWLGAYVVVGRGVLWRWGPCIEAKFDDPRESLEKLYYFGVISRIIICM